MDTLDNVLELVTANLDLLLGIFGSVLGLILVRQIIEQFAELQRSEDPNDPDNYDDPDDDGDRTFYDEEETDVLGDGGSYERGEAVEGEDFY